MIEKIQSIVPETIYQQLNDVISKFSINTPLRLAHFLSQTEVESANFTKTHENLNYSADGLANTWAGIFGAKDANGNYQKTTNANGAIRVVPNALALEIQHQPEQIANHAYSNRYGNGDIASGDGYLHRGRGHIMTTFRANYQAFYTSIGLDKNTDPELVATTYPLLSAAYFWNSKHLNLFADAGDTEDDEKKITEVVNGGLIGEPSRWSQFNKYYSLLTA